MTLLELAKMRNNQQPASVEDIQRKQTQMASSIEKKSNITSNQDSPKDTSSNLQPTVVQVASSSNIINSVPLKNGNKPEPDIRIPEVETWASSDDEPHDVWLDFDTPDPEKVQETDQTNLLSNSDKPVEDESPTLSSDEESEFINSP
uniref:Uncharacterized protein n=1 Tax=Ciona savignyi TaxID=51511 RepID=H2YE89_CIOSA